MGYANHSLAPNAHFVEDEQGRVFLEALQDIDEGEEIFADYGYDPVEPDMSLISSYMAPLSYFCINCRFAGTNICGRKCYDN
jgi:SET domain-containing protein